MILTISRLFLSGILSCTVLFSLLFVAKPTDLEQKVDEITSSWDSDGPGGVIGIVEKGELVFSKAYGMASLEYEVPNTTETIFNIASVSKQFTAYSMVLLEQQGKLSIDDDVRKYLPEIPDFGETITIRHLLNHISGLRNFQNLLSIAGWRRGDSMTNDDLLRFISKQKDLNFPVGSEYLYCNTGFVLTTFIVERVTGQSFQDWTRDNIFLPLDMANTSYREDMEAVHKNTATSYSTQEDGVHIQPLKYWTYMGNGNVYTTVADLAKWTHNFKTGKLGEKKGIERLTERGILTNGETLTYALGIGVGSYRGLKRYSHGGSVGGYRSSFTYFPETETGFIVITNFSAANAGSKARDVINFYMADYLEPVLKPIPVIEEAVEEDKEPEVMTGDQLSQFVGTYYSPEIDTRYDFQIKDDKLVIHHQRHGDISTRPLSPDLIIGGAFFLRNMEVVRSEKGDVLGVKVSNGRVRNLWFEKL